MAIQVATFEQRLELHRNSHEIWGEGTTVEKYIEKCFDSNRYGRAEWWVLTRKGRVLSSLALFSIDFLVSGNIVSGFGIGSVHSRFDFRRQGLAGRLCRHAIRVATERECRLGLLFTDVAPDYYGRMGFSLCLDSTYECHDISSLASLGSPLELEELDVASNLDWIMEAYRIYHARLSFAVFRSDSYWVDNLKENDDLDFLSISNGGKRIGYIRVYRSESMLIPVEIALTTGETTEILSMVYRSLAAMASRQGISTLRGWQPPPSGISQYFTPEVRKKSRPMIWADEGMEISQLAENYRIYSSDYF
jgi:predicted N-acetyltransferase YhbS